MDLNQASEPSSQVIGGQSSSLLLTTPSISSVAVSEDTRTVGTGMEATLDEVLTRDVLIYTQTIANTDTPYLNMLGNLDPWFDYLSAPYIRQRLLGYNQISCGLHITAKVTAPGSAYGLYNLAAVCDGGWDPRDTDVGERELDNATFDSPWNTVSDEHVFLNLEMRNTAELSLPWESPADSFQLSLIDTPTFVHPGCWRLLLFPLAPIRSTIASTATGTIRIYARMEPGYHLENLHFQGKHALTNRMPVPNDNEGPPPKKGSKWSEMGSKAASVAAIAGAAFPAIAPLAEPVAAGLAAISAMGAAFGFTRESAPQEPTPIISRMTSSLAQVDGLDTGEVIAMSMTNALSIDPRAGGGEGEDPMSFASLFERWSIIETLDISPSTALGKFGEIPVTPFYAKATLGTRYFTTAGFVGLPFAYWRGGMEYMIYIPSSTNIEGQIQILWDPSELSTEGVPYTTDPTHR